MLAFRIVITAVLACLLAGCTPPRRYTSAPMTTYDRHTQYAVEDRKNGFVLTVSYSRFQLLPEAGPVAAACKRALTALGQAIAEQRGRPIEPIEERDIRLSFDHNAYTGMTFCSAQARAKWKGSK